MTTSILHDLVLPSCRLAIAALVVSTVIAVVAALLSNVTNALRVFLDISLIEAATMIIVGPIFLFRSQSMIENRGSKILLAGILLFMLTMVASLTTMW